MDEADDNSIWYIDGVSVDDDNDSVGGLRADLEAKNHLPSTYLAADQALITPEIEEHFLHDGDGHHKIIYIHRLDVNPAILPGNSQKWDSRW